MEYLSQNFTPEVATNSPPRVFRVLIADDDPDARTLLEIALSGTNYELIFCEDGDQAIDILKKDGLPELAILDIQMPGASGIEVCKFIKSIAGNTFIPVVLLTSLKEIEDRVNGLDGGADEYITKPFSFPELEARIRALLRIKFLTEQLSKTQDLLEQKERELIAMQVAGGAAHELGQPLQTMLLNFQLIQSLNSNDERFRQLLNTVVEQCKRMGDILKKLNSVREYKTVEYPGNLKILEL